tara:strand:- start:191 stop:412 length:222 start_codon:yes stop_codon:yes gene_type:complete
MAVTTQTISSAEIKPIFSRGTGNTQALGTAHEDAHTFFDFPIQIIFNAIPQFSIGGCPQLFRTFWANRYTNEA